MRAHYVRGGGYGRYRDAHLTLALMGCQVMSSALVDQDVEGRRAPSIRARSSQESPTDIDLLTTLVSLALQVHQAWPVPEHAPTPKCNDHQSSPRSRENFSGR